jgi:prepilin-type N-terminal cleavage/methylation domain-containing protein
MKKRNAFTMIELVFVLLILGILAALAAPRMERSLRQQAADNLLSAIRYTQQLALVDDKTNPRDRKWQQKLWKITFTSGNTLENVFYTVSTDMDADGRVDINETAVNPSNGLYMFNTTGANSGIDDNEDPYIFIGLRYGIDRIVLGGGCTNAQHIAFDHLGRPYNDIGNPDPGGNLRSYSRIVTQDCILRAHFQNDAENNITIIIQRQTGYASLVGQPAS